MVRVLHILSSLGAGGVEMCLYNYYTHMDRDRIHFDFAVHGDCVGFLEAEVAEMGSRIFHVTPKKTSFLQNIREIAKIIRDGHYDVVHVHQGPFSLSSLLAAKRYKVPVKIVHNHGVQNASGLRGILLRLLCAGCRLTADWYFACSDEAGENMFGRRWGDDSKCRLMKTALDLEIYRFDPTARQYLRASVGVAGSDLVVLYAGRMDADKNHRFLLDAFAEIHKEKPSARLLLAGDGAQRQALRQQAEALGIPQAVQFLGEVRNLNAWYSAADVFAFPSKHEGLGMVAMEAQISGLPVICSNGVPKSAAVTDLVHFVPLSEGTSVWSRAILEAPTQNRSNHIAEVRAAGYDIKTESQAYTTWLLGTIGVAE